MSISGLSKKTTIEARSQDYVKSVLESVRGFGSLVVSVIVFGSYVKGDLSENSDVDLIIVVSNSCSTLKIEELDRMIIETQKRFGFAEPIHSLSSKFLNFISKQTGMFVSHFICKEKDFNDLNFVQIFGTNKILTKIFSPQKLVLSGLHDHAKTVYGKDLLQKAVSIKVKRIDLWRSLVMNLVLSLGAILLSFFKPIDAIRFSMESIKWSLHSTYYYYHHNSDKLSLIASNFQDHGIASPHIGRMMQLRNQITIDRKFIFLSPLYTILIHFGHEKLHLVKEETMSWLEILLNNIPLRRPFNYIFFVFISYVIGDSIVAVITGFPIWRKLIWYGWIGLFCFGLYGILYFSESYRKGIWEAVDKIQFDNPDVERKSLIAQLNNFAFGKGNLLIILISVPAVCSIIFLTPTGFYHPLISFYIDLYGAIWIGIFMSIAMWLALSFVMSSIQFSKYSKFKIDLFDPERCGGLKPIGSLSLTGVRMWTIGATAAAALFVVNISPFVIFAISAAMVSVAYFLLAPQYKIHLMMKNARTGKLLEVKKELDAIDDTLKNNPSDSESLQKYIKATMHFNRVEKMQVWPFNTHILIGFILSFVLPVAVMLLGLFVNVPKITLHL